LNTSDSMSPNAYNYWENRDSIVFYLPNSFNISYTEQYHYYRVRAYA